MAEELVKIRLAAMKDSLQAIGRYDRARARERFLRSYDPLNTMCVLYDENIVGFYVLVAEEDHWFLNHIYLHPEFQGNGIGAELVGAIKDKARSTKLPVRLLALKQSDANRFYKNHGFVLTHQEEWDNCYQFTP